MGYEYMQDEAMYAKKVAYRHALILVVGSRTLPVPHHNIFPQPQITPVQLTPTNVGNSYFGSLPIRLIKHSLVGVRARNCLTWWDSLIWKNASNADFEA